MLASFPFAVFMGLVLGWLAGIGVGGGSLLILWLTLVLELPQTTARSVNLMFFLAAAGAVSVFRWRKGTLNWKPILPAVAAGCGAAAIFAWLSTQIEVENFRKLFGILLLFTGIRELTYKGKK